MSLDARSPADPEIPFADAASVLPDDDRAERHLLVRFRTPESRLEGAPRAAFGESLLAGLKRRRTPAAEGNAADQDKDKDDRAVAWLLGHCRRPADDAPRAAFAERTLSELRRRLAGQRPAVAPATPTFPSTARNDDAKGITMLLQKAYQPVDAAPSFQRHLLTDLRRRQLDLVRSRRSARRRAWGGFGIGALAASAFFGVLPALTMASSSDRPGHDNPFDFAVAALPPTGAGSEVGAPAFPPPAPPPLPPLSAGNFLVASAADPDFPTPMPTVAVPSLSRMRPHQPGGLFLNVGLGGGLDAFRLDDAGVTASSLPPVLALSPAETARSAETRMPLDRTPLAWPTARFGERVEVTDLEYRDGPSAPWRKIDRGMVELAAGTRFRNSSADERCGLAFEDGTRVSLLPAGELALTAGGFELERGAAAMAVSEQGTALAWRCPERDLAIEAGTIAKLEVADPDRYAAGGAPAPRLSILGGGLAFARGQGTVGTGALFPGQVYALDHYVTAEIPGRPLCSGERSEIKRLAPAPLAVAEGLAMASDTGRRQTGHPAELRGYVRRSGKWVDPAFVPGTVAAPLAYLSAEYLNLLRARRDLVDELALGPGVVFRDGAVFYELVKDLP